MSYPPDEADVRRLIHACFDSLDDARALLDADPGLVDQRTGMGETALHYLVVENQLEAVKLLFGRGATLNTVSNVSGSPLSEAASLGYEPLVEWLLANGAEIELPGQGEPALTNAATSGNGTIVAMLLAAGADVATRSFLHETALHIAAESDDRIEAAIVLIKAGADLNAVHWDRTPLDVAIDSGATRTIELLRSRGAMSSNETA